MNKSEFMEFIQNEFNIDGSAKRLIFNILTYAETITDGNAQHLFLTDLLSGTIGLTSEEIEKITL